MSKDTTATLGGFSLKWYMTRGINGAIADSTDFAIEIDKAIKRYLACDWGDLGEEDKQLNDDAVKDPGSDRILARYNTSKGGVYIITEVDASTTTILFCSEY